MKEALLLVFITIFTLVFCREYLTDEQAWKKFQVCTSSRSFHKNGSNFTMNNKVNPFSDLLYVSVRVGYL